MLTRTAMITGASGGIGMEMTKYFARDGYDLVLVARSEEVLRELANRLAQEYGVSVRVIAKDLSQPEAPQEIYEELERDAVHVDVLVNNAGYGNYGMFAETDLTKELAMLQLNIVSLTHLSKLFLREMLRKGTGKILNVASTASFQPGPLMAVYYASKAYVLSFSEALANELEGSGVTVTALCPGPTESGFQAKAEMEASKLLKNKSMIMDSDTVAKAGYDGMNAGKTVVIPGAVNKIMASSVGFMPRKLITKVVRKMQESTK